MQHGKNPAALSVKRWNAIYEGEEYAFGVAPNDYLVEKRTYLEKAGKVLFVADGEGRNSVWCAQFCDDVVAFDLSENAVAKAEKLARKKHVHVRYAVSGIDEWSWEETTYDAVVVIFAQFATPNMRARLFANCQKALKKGGILILQGYDVRQLDYKTGGPSKPEHLYTQELLRESFAGMEILELKSYEAFVNEGVRHSGISALIGMVARKNTE